MKKVVGAVLIALIGMTAPSAHAHSDGATLAQSGTECSVRSWEITWGFKESFRAYLSGTIARGGWDTSGNIGYDTPVFTIEGSRGVMSPDGSAGEMVGSGTIRFTGHDGILDQTVSAPRLVIESSDNAVLFFDVVGDTQEGVSIDERDVAFADINIHRYSIDAGAGLWSVTGAPALLTEEGAAAFGTYPAGEPLDAMDIVIYVDDNCLERDNLVALWLVGGGALVALGTISFLVWRRLEGRT